MIQHHIDKDGEWGLYPDAQLTRLLKIRFRDVSIIKGLPTYSMIPVGYGKPVTDGVHVKIPPPPPPPPMTEFEKSLAWMKEFIDDVEHDARSVCEDESERWLGAWGNPTKEQFLHNLTIVSNHCPPRPDTGQDSVLDAPVIGDRRGRLDAPVGG